jgi:UDP-glucose 6-dehydrogenase
VRIAMFGLGYVGRVSAACLARRGRDVLGVDVNPRWPLGAREFQALFPPTLELALHRTRILGWPLTLVVVFRCG